MIDFTIDDGLNARVATFSGAVDDAEMLGAYRRLLSSPDYDPSLNELVDLRGVALDVSGDGLRELVRAFVPLDGRMNGSRRAIVASSDMAYGMGRMYEILRSDAPEEVRVFREIAAAREWLARRVGAERR